MRRKTCKARRSRTKRARIAFAGCGRSSPDAGVTARQRAWLAEHLHFHKEPCGVSDSQFCRSESGEGDCGGAARDRGVLDREAVSWME